MFGQSSNLSAEKLIQQYPLPIAGCHRLSFPEERFSIDLWLGMSSRIFFQPSLKPKQ